MGGETSGLRRHFGPADDGVAPNEPPSALVQKLSRFIDLPEAERRALDAASDRTEQRQRGSDIIVEGDRPDDVIQILAGTAFRYKLTADGRRQIVGFLFPGDLCDPHIFILEEMDHSIAALTPITLAYIPKQKMLDLMEDHPRLYKALWWATLVDEATLREWVFNIGRRPAFQRIAHLLCEAYLRLETVGLNDANQAELAITQAELADAVGLSPVQVNRSLQELRRRGLVKLERQSLRIVDFDRLRHTAAFNRTYLHLERSTS